MTETTTTAPARTTAPALDFKAALIAGLIAGAVFMMLEMALVATVGGGSPWGPPRMIAAIGMGRDVLPPPATFEIGMFVVAMLIHFALSIVLAIVFALIAGRLGLVPALIAGAVFGLALYGLHFYGMTSVFPWFAMARGGIAIFAHISFGVALAWSYKAFQNKVVRT